ncbi:ADOP family duplicated permease [Dickeya chrysanthemi]|uniref:ADOP family duplicated permease n=1 Tax=Dickeya chrysanthemi TaxID=556 RepID=UPI0025A09B13|nr:ADOP family duplicated permease [Dickeya chrysanthemi]WJM85604.1 ADOP family duplicated permease [Dickeya chrysanthemi]
MNFWFDIRYALRLLLKSPGFSVLTITVMACGLGLALYMYSVINTIMYKTLPYPKGEGMVMVTPKMDGESLNDAGLNFLDYEFIRQKATKLKDISYFYADYADLKDSEKSVRYIAVYNTPDMFSYTGVMPFLGRAFTLQDMQSDAVPVAVISYQLWQSYFNGRSDILNQTVKVNGSNTRVVGVMPKGFAFPFYHDLWLPSRLDPKLFPDREMAPEVFVFGRLPSGGKAMAATQELDSLLQDAARQYPTKTNKSISANVLSFQESFTGEETAQTFFVMLSAVGFILLLACFNVGNLLLARSNQRTREIAIRMAIGSPMSRLVMQMLWESLIISSIAGVIGVLLASWGLDITNYIFPKFVPNKVPVWWHLSLDGGLILDAIILILATALITSALPAWKIANGKFAYALRDGANGDQGRKAGRFSRSLVVVEVALSCSILCISVLLLFLVMRATKADYGVPIDNFLVAKINVDQDSYPDDDSRRKLYSALIDQICAIPGVQACGITSSTPGQFTFPHQIVTENRVPEGQDASPYSLVNDVRVMPGSLTAMGAKLLSGREFTESDVDSTLPVAVVSDSFITKYWPHEKAVIGKQLRFRDGNDYRWFTVVGVVSHIIHGRPFSEFKTRPTVYRSLTQLRQVNPSLTMMIKAPQPQRFSKPLLNVLNTLGPTIESTPPQTLSEQLSRNTIGVQFVTNLFLLFGAAAMVLAASGIYGVTQHAINQRTQEIGIRQALGATPTRLLRMLMFSGFRQLFAGLALGLPLAIFAAPKINRVYGDGGGNFMLLFGGVALFIVIIVALATWIPSRRVIMMKPGDAIRYE